MVQNLYACDLFAIDLSVGDVHLIKEGPVVGRVAVDTGSVKNLYAMKGKAGPGLRCRRAPVSPGRVLQEHDAKPVHRGPVRRNLCVATCTPWAIRRVP